MPHSYGYRARTRHTFSQPFRKHGLPSLTKYLTTYKIGDYVDIKVNGAIHKGMPFRFYQGRTGVVWNITPRAVGVEINKQVRNRILKKRIHVRIEHVQPSRCKEDFLKRVKANAEARKKAKETGTKLPLLKRQPVQPKPGKIVKVRFDEVKTLAPLKYELLI